MSDDIRLKSIRADLQLAPTVLYLEGKTDPPVFFALLGRECPKSSIHNDVYVVGLKTQGSGGQEVRARLERARREGLSGTLGQGGVFGVVDGDGRDLATLAAELDPPYPGPLFSWKAYCIENLLARAAWPAAWGTVPSWPNVLGAYVPYAALNRLHVELRRALETLGLEKFRNPQTGQPLESATGFKTALAKDKGVLAGRDVEAMFDREVSALLGAIRRSVDEGHALINGKWLVRHHAAAATNQSEDKCREEWCEAVRLAGGIVEARDLWQRITGSAP
ncbi:MAG: hypothetical protein HYV63_15580 [Candidatus Schekmanbacteria bacterium]|nr:hypothetical protein [Candidatus Schekmanbacteria bacterium]